MVSGNGFPDRGNLGDVVSTARHNDSAAGGPAALDADTGRIGTGGQPPLANRGVATKDKTVIIGNCRGGSFDFLTVSVDLNVAEHLINNTKLDETGYPQLGFARSEHRWCWGGDCWRKFEPRQEMKNLGLEYESWEWSGESSSCAADLLKGHPCRASHVDIAFDFWNCPPDLMSDDVMEMVASHVKERRLKTGISGEDDVNTRYVGSIHSERRIRIYRKDLQNPIDFPCPVMRLELILKSARADEFLQLFFADEPEGMSLAAAHVLEMTGLVVPSERVVVVQSIPADVRLEAEKVASFLAQYSATIDCWRQMGIPITDLAHERALKSSRFSQCRNRKRVERINAEGVQQIIDLVGGLGNDSDDSGAFDGPIEPLERIDEETGEVITDVPF